MSKINYVKRPQLVLTEYGPDGKEQLLIHIPLDHVYAEWNPHGRQKEQDRIVDRVQEILDRLKNHERSDHVKAEIIVSEIGDEVVAN